MHGWEESIASNAIICITSASIKFPWKHNTMQLLKLCVGQTEGCLAFANHQILLSKSDDGQCAYRLYYFLFVSQAYLFSKISI